jgi:SAM-dependent methyltransferase
MKNRFATQWKHFWDDKTVPLHRRDAEDHYAEMSSELRILFPTIAPQSVLEIGCGNGALFRHLEFDQVQEYTGVDFSHSMLDEFQRRHPGTNLVEESGHSFHNGRSYDLIFSNGVLQYFDRPMVAEHFRHAAQMLSPSGSFVCGSIPWRCFRTRYLMGRFHRLQRGFVKSLFRFSRSFYHDPMGRWFDWRDLEDLGLKHGLVAQFYGSLHYPYRFHAVLRHRDAMQSKVATAA